MTNHLADNLTRAIELPLPGDEYDGRTVIASCWLRDDGLCLGLLMLLNDEPDYYSVAQVEHRNDHPWGYWHNNGELTRRNINEATALYADSGGDI